MKAGQQTTIDWDALPLSRSTDGPGSREAAKRHVRSGKLSGNRAIVLEALRKWPGRTSRELSELCGFDRHETARRLSDLGNMGLAEKCGVRADGKEALWRAT